MGASGSSEVPIKAGPNSIQGDNLSIDNIKEAYEKGRLDGTTAFQSTLEQVAAQVYDNVHTELTNIQNDSLEKSKTKIKDIKSKLTVSNIKSNPCQNQELLLLKCMKDNQNSNNNVGKEDTILACKEMVNAYLSCATKASLE